MIVFPKHWFKEKPVLTNWNVTSGVKHDMLMQPVYNKAMKPLTAIERYIWKLKKAWFHLSGQSHCTLWCTTMYRNTEHCFVYAELKNSLDIEE